MHTTGSSSIQHNLAKITDAADWRLMVVGGRSNMGPALHAMVQSSSKCFWFAKSGTSSEMVAQKGEVWRNEFRKIVKELNVENFIVSAEALSSFSRESIVALRDFITPLFDEVRVIGYVRPPVAFKISRFQENVKHGNGIFNVADIKLNYRAKFKKFDDIFGRSNVILRKFAPSTFPDQCIVADFCQQTGIIYPENTPVRRINESLSREACGILYAYRKFSPGYGVGRDVIRENLRVVRPLFAVKGAKFKVPTEFFSEALALEGRDISWMEKRLGVSLKESAAANGSEVTCEDDLLKIKQSSCEEYAARFRELYEVDVPQEWIPQGDPVDPVQVAEFMDQCRTICRKAIVEKRESVLAARARLKKSFSYRIRRFPGVTIRVIKRLLSGQSPRGTAK